MKLKDSRLIKKKRKRRRRNSNLEGGSQPRSKPLSQQEERNQPQRTTTFAGDDRTMASSTSLRVLLEVNLNSLFVDGVEYYYSDALDSYSTNSYEEL